MHRWLLLLLIPLLAAADDRWIEIRSGPFQVLSDAGDRDARLVLNQLEQIRYLLGIDLGIQNLKTTWPVRIVISKSLGPAPPVLKRDTYTGSLPANSAMLPACLGEVVRILIQSNAGRMPVPIESGLVEFYSTAQASGPKVTLGAPPPGKPDEDWARIRLLEVDPDYSGKIRVLLYNLQRGGDLAPACRNAFAKTPAEIEKQVQASLASGNFPSVTVGARPLNPDRDFSPTKVEGPLGAVALADLQPDEASARAAWKALLTAAPAEAHEALGLMALRQKHLDEARAELTMAVETGSTSARAWVENARLLSDAAKARAELEKAAKLNPNWAEPYLVLASLETDDSRKLQWLKTAASLEPRNSARWVAVAELYMKHNKYVEADKAWNSAELSATDDAERSRIRQERDSISEKRLAYEIAERKRAEDEKQRDIQRVKDAAMAQIHAAEERANLANRPSSPIGKVETMPIAEAPAGKVRGQLVRVDCIGRAFRLVIRDAQGTDTRLLIRNPGAVSVMDGQLSLRCGALSTPRNVTVEYQPKASAKLGTAGEVVTVIYE